jgi:hypothetical protein
LSDQISPRGEPPSKDARLSTGYGGVAIQRTLAPGVPLDRFRFAAVTAWEARSEIIPKTSIEPPGASKSRSIAFRKFQPFSPNQELSMACGRTAAKKFADRAVRRTWSRSAEANGPLGVLGHPVNCVSRLRGLSSSIQTLAFRRLIYFEAAPRSPPQSPCERPAPPTRRPLAG